jgi:hypothetical protein
MPKSFATDRAHFARLLQQVKDDAAEDLRRRYFVQWSNLKKLWTCLKCGAISTTKDIHTLTHKKGCKR